MSDEKNESARSCKEQMKMASLSRLDIDNPLLCHTEFWKQRGGKTSYSDLQEDFYERISKQYGAERGKSTSLIMNTNERQRERFGRYEGDEYDELYFDDTPF